MGKKRIEQIQRVLSQHQSWWHGGATEVRVGCKGNCPWSASVKTLDEALTLHERHAAEKVAAVLIEKMSRIAKSWMNKDRVCNECGYEIVVTQATEDGCDYWYYCSNKTCVNHGGEQLGDMEECSFAQKDN